MEQCVLEICIFLGEFFGGIWLYLCTRLTFSHSLFYFNQHNKKKNLEDYDGYFQHDYYSISLILTRYSNSDSVPLEISNITKEVLSCLSLKKSY